MGNDLLSGFGRHSDPCFDILFCSLLAADAALVPQELLRRESSEFSPMVRDPFYVVSAGARWVCVRVPCVTAGPALPIPCLQQLSWLVKSQDLHKHSYTCAVHSRLRRSCYKLFLSLQTLIYYQVLFMALWSMFVQ